jgi:hypothetical protein
MPTILFEGISKEASQSQRYLGEESSSRQDIG